ncbi:MAG: hypothetical protein DSM106950_17185 [Stigonema ocellatum SAG 48.90 = DSM 106950]|nr:hypothetical protein [Stigonema ocellatum SAG 48.90 = DSM 106950]
MKKLIPICIDNRNKRNSHSLLPTPYFDIRRVGNAHQKPHMVQYGSVETRLIASLHL